MSAPRLILAALAAGLIAACSQPPLPEDSFYRLPGGPEAAQGPPAPSGLVEVQRLIADGLAAGRPIVHTGGPEAPRVRTYHYHFWAEPPPILLQNRLAAFLRARRVGTQVVTPEMRIEPDYVVSGKIRRFEQVTGAENGVVVELELAFKDMKSDRLVHQDSYRVAEPAPDATVPAAVMAIGRAVDGIFARFIDDLRAARR